MLLYSAGRKCFFLICIYKLSYYYVFSSLAWNKVNVLPPESPIKDFRGFASASAQEDWFFFGGIKNLKYSNSLFKFNSKSNYWTSVDSLGEVPCPRSGATLTLLNKSLILFGGQNYDGTFSDIFSLDLESFLWKKVHTPYYIESRTSHSATTDGKSIFIFGGYNENGLYLNDLWELSIEDNVANFKILADGTVCETENASITYLLGKLYLIGGYKNNTNKVWEFDEKWTAIVPPIQINLPQGHTCIRIGHSILLLGGMYNSYSLISQNNQLWAFSTKSGKWSLLPQQESIYPLAAAVLHDTIYIIDEDYNIHSLDNLPLCGLGGVLCSEQGNCEGKICSCKEHHYGYDCGLVNKPFFNEEPVVSGDTDTLKVVFTHIIVSLVLLICLYVVKAKWFSSPSSPPEPPHIPLNNIDPVL